MRGMLEYLNQRTGAVTLSVVSNTTLIVLKIVIGVYTGSVSIISEAIHSSTDLLAAIIAFFAIRSAVRPPDEQHPYGHGKLESLAATVEALLIVAAAGLITFEAARRLYYGAVIENVEWGIGVMAFSSAVNFAVSRHLFRVAQRTESPALSADAWHLATDLYTALGVGIGLVIVRLTGIKAFDPLVAIGVALFILKAAWDIARGALADLLDESLPESNQARIRAVLDAHRQLYSNVRVMRTRRAGGGRRVYVALEFPPTVSMADAHAVTEHLEQEIRVIYPGSSVTVEAEAPSSAETPGNAIETVERVARRLGVPVHHVSAYASDGRFNLSLHLEVDPALSLADAHSLATRLEDELRREIPRLARVDTHIEPSSRQVQPDQEQVRARAQVQAALQEMAEHIPQVRGVHDIQVRTSEGNLTVSLHCALDGSVSIGEAHRISDEIVEGLKHRLPQVQSVLVHTEPQP
jgi:cation diffusion facilitator family transporter